MSMPQYIEEHDRGELLVAAMMNAFLEIWTARLDKIGFVTPRQEGPQPRGGGSRARRRSAADHGDPRPRLLPADRHHVRRLSLGPAHHRPRGGSRRQQVRLSRRFAEALQEFRHHACRRSRCRRNLEAMRQGAELQPDPFRYDAAGREEVFRFIWENRAALEIDDRGYTEVQSVRPSHPDRAGRLHVARNGRRIRADPDAPGAAS